MRLLLSYHLQVQTQELKELEENLEKDGLRSLRVSNSETMFELEIRVRTDRVEGELHTKIL